MVPAETRRREIADRLRATGAVTVAELEERFGVSPMTARRDLAELERRGVVRRTHGGAVLPTISAHEDSFARRLDVDAEQKLRLAEAAVALLHPRETDRLFLSVKGIAANGMLTDADPLEAELKRTMIEQAGESVLLIDHTKLSLRGLSVIAPIAEIATTIATGLDDAQADTLRLGGTTVLGA